MKEETNNEATVTLRHRRMIERRRNNSEMDLSTFRMLERSQMLRLIVFLSKKERLFMNIYPDGNFGKGADTKSKMDIYVGLGIIRYTDVGRQRKAELTDKGRRMADHLLEIERLINGTADSEP